MTGSEDRIAAVFTNILPVVRIAGAESGWALTERLSHYSVPAVSIAVADGGRPAWARAVGSLEAGSGNAATVDSLFQAASMSKVVNALAVLRMVEAGRLDLDRDVNTWLSGWRVPDNDLIRQEPVTLRRILSHTAGLTIHGFGGYPSDSPLPSITDVLNGAPASNPNGEHRAVFVDHLPGSRQRYSGGGSTVAQYVLEQVTSQGYEALLNELVLAPLALKRSTFRQPHAGEPAGDRAVGHGMDGKPIPGKWRNFTELGAAGLWTTPSEYLRVFLEIARAYRGESVMLGRDMAREMLTPQPGGSFGLGPQVFGEGEALYFQHAGGNEGYQCNAIMFPASGKGAVVMTNAPGGLRLCLEIFNAVASVYDWPDYLQAPKQPVMLTAGQQEKYVGTYRVTEGSPEGAAIRIWRDAGKLYSRVEGDPLPPEELLLDSSGRMFTAGSPYEVEVGMDDSGRAAELTVLEGGYPILRAGIQRHG